MDRERALKAVDSIYAAALGETEWPLALEVVSDSMGGSAATLELHDIGSGRMLSFESARLAPETVAAYVDHYAAINPRPSLLRRAGLQLTFDHLFMSEQEMDDHPFYAEFLSPVDLRYFVATQTPLFEGQVKGVIAVQRPGRIRGADHERIEAMRLLAPHVSRALRLYWNRVGNAIDPDRLDRTLGVCGLTGAERRLAIALGVGETIPAYARRHGISINTAYTHYRRVKEKLGCARQSETVTAIRAL